MEVYLVERQHLGDEKVVAVCSTKELAERLIKKYGSMNLFVYSAPYQVDDVNLEENDIMFKIEMHPATDDIESLEACNDRIREFIDDSHVRNNLPLEIYLFAPDVPTARSRARIAWSKWKDENRK